MSRRIGCISRCVGAVPDRFSPHGIQKHAVQSEGRDRPCDPILICTRLFCRNAVRYVRCLFGSSPLGFPSRHAGSPSRLHQPTMAASVTWGRVVVDLDDGEGAVGLFRPIRRVEKLCQRGGPYCTQGVSVIQCADGGLYQPMRRGLDLDGHAAVGLPQPTPRVAEYLARCGIVLPGLPRVPVCADTLLDVDSDSDVAPTELDSDSDGDIGVLPVAARVT